MKLFFKRKAVRRTSGFWCHVSWIIPEMAARIWRERGERRGMAFGILGWARRFYSAEDRRPDGRHFSGKNHFHLCRLSAEQRMQPLTRCGQMQHGETWRYEGGERRDIAIAKKNLRHEAASVRTGSTPNKRKYCQRKALEGLIWEVRKSSGMGVVTQRNHLNNGSGAAPFHHRFSFFHLPLDQEPTKKFEPLHQQIEFFT